jgi:hypothetical protein
MLAAMSPGFQDWSPVGLGLRLQTDAACFLGALRRCSVRGGGVLPLSLATLKQLLRNGGAGAQVGNLCGEHTFTGMSRHLQVVSLGLFGWATGVHSWRGSGRNSTCSCSTCADFSILAHACTWATPHMTWTVVTLACSMNCSSYVCSTLYIGT